MGVSVATGELLIQVHIPKCAGTSIAVWMRAAAVRGAMPGFRAFYDGTLLNSEADFFAAGFSDPRLTAISSHHIRRFPAHICGRPAHYFAVLRRPLAHFLSVVRYMIQERPAFNVPDDVSDDSIDIARWLLNRPLGSIFGENTQTNHLALYRWCDATGGRCDPATMDAWSARDLNAYRRDRLGIAKEEMQKFIGIGTVDRLDEFLPLLVRRAATFGIQLPSPSEVQHNNVTSVPLDDTSWIYRLPLGQQLRDSLAVDQELFVYAEGMLAGALSFT